MDIHDLTRCCYSVSLTGAGIIKDPSSLDSQYRSRCTVNPAQVAYEGRRLSVTDVREGKMTTMRVGD